LNYFKNFTNISDLSLARLHSLVTMNFLTASFKIQFIFFIAALLAAAESMACPKVHNLIDYNCDGKIKIAITGDSVVKGLGADNFDEGGYVDRLQRSLPFVNFDNLGIAGTTTGRLLRAFKSRLEDKADNITKHKTYNNDLIIIDLGRNDYWLKVDPSVSARNIQRIGKYIAQKSEQATGTAPLVVISTLLPSHRAYQQPFINALNARILGLSKKDMPVDLFFNKLPNNLVGRDGIHPDDHGYEVIAKFVYTFIRNEAQKLLNARRPDTDKDGIYDLFEINKYGTDPNIADTDGDTLSDGDEVFVYHTNPLAVDSDGDGIPDNIEVHGPIPTPTATAAAP
jgi:lysophospholipase L1-like esterase